MKRLGWMAAALATLVMSCVDAEPDRTNVSIEREAPPATTVIETDESAAPAGDTNVDVDVDATDDTPEVVID